MQRSNKRDLARTARRNSFGGGLESLETRQMFSGVGANFYLVPVNHRASTQLVCDLTSPSETVTANSFYDGIQFFVNGQMANIFGNYSYMSIMAQSGNNTIVIDKNITVRGDSRPGHNDGTNDGMVWISVAEAWSVANDVGAVAA